MRVITAKLVNVITQSLMQLYDLVCNSLRQFCALHVQTIEGLLYGDLVFYSSYSSQSSYAEQVELFYIELTDIHRKIWACKIKFIAEV